MVFASLCDILESVADHQQLNRIAKYGNCCKVKDSHAGSQNGTQVCNACTALALVCRVARRANQRLMPLRERRQAATARNDSRRSSTRIQKVTAKCKHVVRGRGRLAAKTSASGTTRTTSLSEATRN